MAVLPVQRRPTRGVASALTTASVAPDDAFDYWRDVICALFVGLDAQPVADRFSGSVDHVALGDIAMTTVVSCGHDVRRTKSLIAAGGGEFTLLSIQVSGRGRVQQGDHVALLAPGSMAFYDTTRPYRLSFDAPFEQLVVQVPRDVLVRATGLPDGLTDVTARALAGPGTAAVVAGFFQALARARREDPAATNLLHPQAVGLLAAAAVAVAGPQPRPGDAAALNGTRIREYVRAHFADPGLSVAVVAEACGMSRRTVFRALEAEHEGLSGLIRRTRVEHAKSLLLSAPSRPLSAVSGASGFANDATFFRAFREVTGTTPARFRAACAVDGGPSVHRT